jgi:hypothetical protein
VTVFIFIPRTSTRRTVTVKMSAPRFVTCEKCGHGYGYWVDRTATSSATTSVLGLPVGGADRLVTDAEIKAQDRLKYACEAVPCPECGWYQRHMLDRARREHFAWLVIAGWIGLAVGLLLTLFGGFAVAVLCELLEAHHHRLAPLLLVARAGYHLVSGLLLFSPVAGYLLREWLAKSHDPNAEDVEERKQKGWDRSMSPKQYARVVPKGEAKGTNQKLRLEDLE